LHLIFWMSAIFLLPVCLTYWSRKYTTRVDPHVDNFHKFWSWYDHTLPSYSVFVCWCITWLCDLDFWPFDLEQLLCMAGHVTNLATKFEDTTPIRWLPLKMRTLLMRMRRITWPASRGSKTIIFLESPTLICLCTMHIGGSTMNVIKDICENNARPVLKDVWVSAHARNHVICQRYHKCPIAVVFVDVDLPYWALKVEHIAAFTAIFSNICTAHAQKRLFMNYRCKLWHRRSIHRPRFPSRVQNFGDLAKLSVEFCILCVECPPYFYFRFVWPTDLESIPHASTPRR